MAPTVSKRFRSFRMRSVYRRAPSAAMAAVLDAEHRTSRRRPRARPYPPATVSKEMGDRLEACW